MSAAYIGAYEEAVQLYLDPGNVHCSHRLTDLLRDIDRVLGVDVPGVIIIRRLDAGYDSFTHRRLLASLPGHFILKSHQAGTGSSSGASCPGAGLDSSR